MPTRIHKPLPIFKVGTQITDPLGDRTLVDVIESTENKLVFKRYGKDVTVTAEEIEPYQFANLHMTHARS